jgi:mRNA interferase MazF
MQIRRGEIYEISLDPTIGREMRKTRPGVVVSDNAINDAADVVIICPITDSTLKETIIHILIPDGEGGLHKESVAHCGQIRAVDKSRIGRKLGELSAFRMAKVSAGVKHALALW